MSPNQFYSKENNTQYYGQRSGPGLWSGIFAGFFIAGLAFWTLFSLGLAIGGHSLTAIARDDLGGLGAGAGVWTFISAVVGCFLGGYFCSRLVSYASWKAGIAEGLVVSALLFLALGAESGLGVGIIGAGAAKTASLASGAASSLAAQPQIQTVVGNSLDGMTFKSDPNTVATQLITLLIRDDRQGARNYLAYQTGMSPAEIEGKISAMSNSFNQAADEIKDKAGMALASIGWFGFISMIVGSMFCCLGAAMGNRQNQTSMLGSNANVSRPIAA